MAIAGLVVALAVLGPGTVAGAASVPAARLTVRSGSSWTIVDTTHHRCVETVAFHPGRFLGDDHGDAGTWSTKGSKLVMVFRAGVNSPSTFASTYDNASRYNAVWRGRWGSVTASLLPASRSHC